MNIGFIESLKEFNEWDCFFFHDVDMFPMDKRLIYECNSTLPKHFAVAVSKFDFRIKGYMMRYFGGVTSFTKNQFLRINGFSNLFFGWGSEGEHLAVFPLINKFELIFILFSKMMIFSIDQNLFSKKF
jgi:hypothetical protein